VNGEKMESLTRNVDEANFQDRNVHHRDYTECRLEWKVIARSGIGKYVYGPSCH
jgi:hypothetical protein